MLSGSAWCMPNISISPDAILYKDILEFSNTKLLENLVNIYKDNILYCISILTQKK